MIRSWIVMGSTYLHAPNQSFSIPTSWFSPQFCGLKLQVCCVNFQFGILFVKSQSSLMNSTVSVAFSRHFFRDLYPNCWWNPKVNTPFCWCTSRGFVGLKMVQSPHRSNIKRFQGFSHLKAWSFAPLVAGLLAGRPWSGSGGPRMFPSIWLDIDFCIRFTSKLYQVSIHFISRLIQM